MAAARQPRAKKADQLSLGVVVTDPDKHRQQLATKERKCLTCGNGFMSWGAGNRICPRCKGLDQWAVSDLSINAAF